MICRSETSPVGQPDVGDKRNVAVNGIVAEIFTTEVSHRPPQTVGGPWLALWRLTGGRHVSEGRNRDRRGLAVAWAAWPLSCHYGGKDLSYVVQRKRSDWRTTEKASWELCCRTITRQLAGSLALRTTMPDGKALSRF